MDEETQNALARLLTGGLSEQERDAAVTSLLTDPEASQLLSLFALPELRTENNLPIPFTTVGEFVLAYCQNLFLPLEMHALKYTGWTAGLAARAAAILKAGRPMFTASAIEFESVAQSGGTPIRFTVRSSTDNTACLLEVYATHELDRVLEFWEGGAVVLRAPLKALLTGLSYRIQPGTSLAIREAGAQEGCRLLVVETEFRQQEWTAALVSACLSGEIGLATHLLRTQLATHEKAVSIRTRMETQFAALASLTKTYQHILQPAPLTRAGDIHPDQRLWVYGLVWNGVIQCWPEAAAIPNPWFDVAASQRGETSTAEGRASEVGLLAMACVRSALGGPTQDPPSDVADPRLRNGWTALAGWGALLDRDFESARRIFGSTELTSQDPFGLGLGRKLSDHLLSFEGMTHQARAASGDQVWEWVLSPLN